MNRNKILMTFWDEFENYIFNNKKNNCKNRYKYFKK